MSLYLGIKFGQDKVDEYLARSSATDSGANDNDRSFYAFLDSAGVDGVLF